MAHSGDPTFREKAVEFFTRALGQPHRLDARPAALYRWALDRPDKSAPRVYITLDSPEFSDIAHLMIGDPGAAADERLESFVMRTEDEFATVLARIREHLAS